MKNRLLAAMRLDLQLQARYGLLYAGGFLLVMWATILRFAPDELVVFALIFALFADVALLGFYFIAGMVLFEKDERTLYAVVTTPLRFAEYLVSKVVTITALATLTSLAVAVAVVGLGFNVLWFLLGIALCSLVGLLAGFIAVSPFQSISDFILPSALILLPLGLPLFGFLGIWQSWVFYLIPTQGALILLQAAFTPVEAWQIVYAILYQLLWIGLLAWIAQLAFTRLIVARGG